jgi:hypothetical protein
MFLVPALDLDTPSSTRSGTRSDTLSSTAYCTKMEGDLAVMVLAASDGKIGHVGFVHACPLQLLSSRQLSFSCSKRAIIGSLCFIS